MPHDATSSNRGGLPIAPQAIDELEAQIHVEGIELWNRIQGQVPGIFNRGYWQGRMLDRAMSDPSFKIDLLRFVDVLPMLQTNQQVSNHLRQCLLKPGREMPALLGTAIKLAAGGIGSGLAAKAIRKNVTDMAKRFIVGQDAAEALPVLRELHRQGLAFTVDLLGEATISDAEADACQRRYLDLIENLPEQVNQWPGDPISDRNHAGPMPRTNISIKLSAMEAHLDVADLGGSVGRLMDRVLPLFLRAREKNVFLNLDMEQWSLNQIACSLFEQIAMRPKLRDWPHIGIVVQAYLKQARQQAQRMLELVRRRGTPLTIRLVKGAYWDYEIITARQNGYECPVFTQKSDTDANYEALSAMLLGNYRELATAIASHNLRSLTHAMVLARRMGVPREAMEIQMLYGMAEPLRQALRQRGYRVRLYTPVGQLLPGMAYLVRRLLENTSNSGFLKLSYHDQADVGQLLSAPDEMQVRQERQTLNAGESSAARTGPTPLSGSTGEGNGQASFDRALFVNCPLTDFTDPPQRASFEQAVQRRRSSGPIPVPTVVVGIERSSGQVLQRECPSELSRMVSNVATASRQDVDEAVAAANEAYPAWRDRSLEQRADLLDRLGQRLRQDRHDLAALECFEAAKPWREADADVAEAIDFCHYYARRAREELPPQVQGRIAGENNVLYHQGRGVAAIIAPWNFPLAILTGMAAAALVAGNPVILKPAEQSSAIGFALYRRMIEAGFDPRIVQFLPGAGEVVGTALVEHPLVAQIAFTGSMAVGLKILEQAAKVRAGQPQVKRVVCEMGGKNAIIVDDDADLDEAVLGVIRSGFGYTGQKCSACSRVVVVGSVYEPFVARLAEACRSLDIGPADDPAFQLGPVIDREAYERLRRVIADPGPGARAIYAGESPDLNGYYVAPAIFEVSDPRHCLMRDELFGPVLAIMRAQTFAQAIEIANTSAYKLTGAVFSRSPEHLDLARAAFRVGNLYLNRGSTGAIVGRQPFGGFGMSGTGAKAGGSGYLLNFAESRVVCENTMRRGVAPELENQP